MGRASNGSTIIGPLRRVSVGRATQAQLRALIARRGKGGACTALRCSAGTLDDAIAPGATLRPDTLARVEAALARLA